MTFWGDEELLVFFIYLIFFLFWQFIQFPGEGVRTLLSIHYL